MKRLWLVLFTLALVLALCVTAPTLAEDADIMDALEKDGFCLADLDGDGTVSRGDTVYFGTYPQIEVKDDTLAEALSAKLREDGWTDFGFLAEGASDPVALFQDVDMDGTLYRAVRIQALRPWYATLPAGEDTSNVDDNGFVQGIYFFRFEPIAWTVLTVNEDGTALLHALTALDSQPYQATYEGTGNATVPGTEAFTNNWEHSTIRAFLNSTFRDTAFSEKQKDMLKTTVLDNVNSTEKPTHKYAKNQKDTEDQVFLLAYTDLINPDFGFSTKANYSKDTQGEKINDTTDPVVLDAMHKRRTFTDYSAAMGVRTSRQAVTESGEPALAWMLRSPGATSTAIYMVNKYGSLQSQKTQTVNNSLVDCLTYNSTNAVVPAVNVTLRKSIGAWQERTWDYRNAEGETEHLDYYLYVPASAQDGGALPMITWIADASMLGKSSSTLLKQKAPILWTKEEKMSSRPAFFLTFGFKNPGEGYEETSAMGQIVPITDAVTEEFGIDQNRLYLTGQSFGGIADFTLNTLYPEKWAATYYVACQPGGSGQIEGDAQAEAVMAAKAFEGQKFIYIASQLDEKAWPGQMWIRDALASDGIGYEALDGIKYKGKTLEADVEALLEKGSDHIFLSYSQLTKNGSPDSEHMDTWRYAYGIDSVWNWLLDQTK
ncbi:MAG: hypothetical protein IJ083_06040 [Clostridia bacterium]|nr:hypothetical protein [Clostridia bacterium]